MGSKGPASPGNGAGPADLGPVHPAFRNDGYAGLDNSYNRIRVEGHLVSKGEVMRNPILDFMVKPLLALAVALPVVTMAGVGQAEAHHKHWRKGAAIAGAIIGGAIIYDSYRRHRHYRHHGYYGSPYRGYYGHGGYYKRRGYYGHRGYYHGPRRVIRYRGYRGHRHCHRHRGHRRSHCH